MASWMVHLRIADKLLDCFPNIEEEAFIMGNIAPDSGEPSEDWSYFVPDSNQTHYRKRDAEGKLKIGVAQYIEEYFTPEMQASYTAKQYSFYLGYLTHLMTDVLWTEIVWGRTKECFPEEIQADKNAFLWKCKGDWYDLDHLYLKKHPDFRAFRIYEEIQEFKNTYIDMFSEKAFENRKAYIVGFYREEHENLDREYIYLTEPQVDAFVGAACERILEWLSDVTGEREITNVHDREEQK